VHAGDPARVVEQRAGDGDLLDQPGAGDDRVRGEPGVEVAPAAHQAVARPAVQRRPVDLGHLAAAGDPQPPVADPAGGVDAQVVERLDRAGGQPVAADLLAGQPGLLQDDDVEAGAGEVPRGRGARRTGTDDDHVGPPVAVVHLGPLRSSPRRPCELVHKVARSLL
jgi:hypothetical protein